MTGHDEDADRDELAEEATGRPYYCQRCRARLYYVRPYCHTCQPDDTVTPPQ